MNQYIQYLERFVNERRLKIFRKILLSRTRYITVVLEDIFQPQNASAVIRSCDAFGIQDIHFIENRNKYTINPRVTHGSDKWLSIHRYNEKPYNTPDVIQHLRNNNYRIIAATPHHDSTDFENLDMGKGKVAIFFGTEKKGLTPQVIDQADERIRIPMHGFSESLNLSVSAALILWSLIQKLHNSGIEWRVDIKDAEQIYLEWLKKSVPKAETVEKYFFEYINKPL